MSIGSKKALWIIVPIGLFLLFIGTLVEIFAISFSVTGLDKLFPMPGENAKLFYIYTMGFTPIMIAAGLVEFSKLGIEFSLTAMTNIGRPIPLFFRIGLRGLQIFLILITGLGIYGFYTQQFIENNSDRKEVEIEIRTVDQEITNLKEQLEFRRSEKDRLQEEENVQSQEIREEAEKKIADIKNQMSDSEKTFNKRIEDKNQQIYTRQKGSQSAQNQEEYKNELRKERDENLIAKQKQIDEHQNKIQKLEKDIEEAKAKDNIFSTPSEEVRKINEPKIQVHQKKIDSLRIEMDIIRQNFLKTLDDLRLAVETDKLKLEKEISDFQNQKTSLTEDQDKKLAEIREKQDNITLVRDQKLAKLKEEKQEELSSIKGDQSDEQLNKSISELKAKHLSLTQEKESMRLKIGPIAYVAKLFGLLKENNKENVEHAVQAITIVWATLLSFFGVTMMRLGANVLFSPGGVGKRYTLRHLMFAAVRRILKPKIIEKVATKEIEVPVEVLKEVPVEKIVKVEVPIGVPMSAVTNAKLAEVEGRMETEGKA